MNYFSKKLSTTLVISSVILFALSAVLVLFSNQFIDFTYNFLSQKVFHREFSIEKWLPSMLSFFLVPSFIIVLFNAIVFVKYPIKHRIFLIFSLFVIVLFMILYGTYVSTRMHVISDLGSEIWLGKICLEEHSFWPLGWYYSTEIRLLNTQFFSALGFLFTNNWDAVITIQTFCCCVVLFLSVLYLLNQLEIKTLWLRILTCVLSVFPWSALVWYVGPGQNYYIPHAVMSIFFVATFIKLACRSENIRHLKAVQVLLYTLAFISGLSSIRYILIFVFPMAIAAIIIEARKPDRTAEITNFKEFWLHNKNVFYAVTTLFASGLGYICNNIILQHFWEFSEWNSMGFAHFGETTLRDIWKGLVSIFGYREGIAVFTPGGIINILVYLGIILFATDTFYYFKKSKKSNNSHNFIIMFFISTMTLNTFLYIHVDYTARYYYPIIIYIIPMIAMLLESSFISSLKKFFLGTIWSILIINSTFSTIQSCLTSDSNTDRYPVAKFLEENGYDFGYATFENSTVFTYLTHGKVEIGMLALGKKSSDFEYLPEKYVINKWLTPKRLYDPENHKDKKVFLILSQPQYQEAKNFPVFDAGKLVYNDDFYRVYEYENHGAFIKAY